MLLYCFVYAVKIEGQCMGPNMHTRSNLVKVFMSFQDFNGKRRSLKIAEPGWQGIGAQFFTINNRRHILHSSHMQSASDICHFAW